MKRNRRHPTPLVRVAARTIDPPPYASRMFSTCASIGRSRQQPRSVREGRVQLALLSALNAERTARRAAILVTETASGEQRLVREAEVPRDPLAPLLEERLRSGKSGTVEADGRQLFLNVQVPSVKAVVIGAVHISQALAPMARG